jgi:hypothetical protein
VDYGKLLRRTWEVIWNNKFLIILGIVIALCTVEGNNAQITAGGNGDGGEPGYPPSGEFQIPENFEELQEQYGDLMQEFEEDLGFPVRFLWAGICGFFIVIILIGLVLWIITTLARGGLIAGVNEIELVGSSGFGQSVSAAWQRGWRLIGIGLVPAIPNLILFIIGASMFLSYFGTATNYRDALENLVMSGAGVGMVFGMGMLVCAGALVGIVLEILRTFAERACMIEDKGVFNSYGRGWEVLRDNIAEAFLLLLIQIGINIGLFMVLFLPSLVMVLCCFLWPLLLVIEGIIKTYFLTMWTLAWREWTGGGPGEELVVEEAPAA